MVIPLKEVHVYKIICDHVKRTMNEMTYAESRYSMSCAAKVCIL